MQKSSKRIIPILFRFKKPLSILAATAVLLGTQLPVSADSTGAPVMTGYTVSTNHDSSVIQYSTDGKNTPTTDIQFMDIDVTFDKPLKAAAGAASDLAVTLNGSTQGSYINTTDPTQSYNDAYANHITATASGNTLHIVFYYGFAQYFGKLSITPAASNGAITKITGTDGTPVQWTNISCLVPNGIKLSTVSQTPADPAAGVSASVTKQVVTPKSATRGAVFYLFLKNGKPVGYFSPSAGSFAVHYHMYLVLNAPTYASYFTGSFGNYGFDSKGSTPYSSAYGMTVNGDKVTITSKKDANGKVTDAAGDVLDLLVYAYPRDRATQAYKSDLNAAISKASALTASDYTAASYAAVQKQLDIAESMTGSIYYLQNEIDTQTGALNTAIGSLKKTTSSFSESSVSSGSGTSSAVSSASASGTVSAEINPNTGADTSSMAPSAILFGGAAAVLLAVCLKKRRR